MKHTAPSVGKEARTPVNECDDLGRKGAVPRLPGSSWNFDGGPMACMTNYTEVTSTASAVFVV